MNSINLSSEQVLLAVTLRTDADAMTARSSLYKDCLIERQSLYNDDRPVISSTLAPAHSNGNGNSTCPCREERRGLRNPP